MKTAFGYCRVSSVGQSADDRDGIPRQKAAISKWAASNDVQIVRWFEDSVSGTKDLENRPALQAMIQALHENGTRLVVIEKLDRLARDLMVQESIIKDFQRNGFEIVSVAEPDLCSEDPSRKLMRQVLGAFAEYERTMIVQKLRGARQRARAAGKHSEGIYAYGEDPRRPEEVAVVERIRQLRASGLSYYMIAKRLNEEGIKPRLATKWHHQTIEQVVTRAV